MTSNTIFKKMFSYFATFVGGRPTLEDRSAGKEKLENPKNALAMYRRYDKSDPKNLFEENVEIAYAPLLSEAETHPPADPVQLENNVDIEVIECNANRVDHNQKTSEYFPAIASKMTSALGETSVGNIVPQLANDRYDDSTELKSIEEIVFLQRRRGNSDYRSFKNGYKNWPHQGVMRPTGRKRPFNHNSQNICGPPVKKSIVVIDLVTDFEESENDDPQLSSFENLENLENHGHPNCLLLQNPEEANHCFMNCAINMLFACKKLRNTITSREIIPKSPLANGIRAIFLKKLCNVSRIRDCFEGLQAGQHDAGEILVKMLETLNEEQVDLSGIKFHPRSSCNCDVQNQEVEDSFIRLTIVDEVEPRPFSYWSEKWESELQHCQSCRVKNHVSIAQHCANGSLALPTYYIIQPLGMAMLSRFNANDQVTMFEVKWYLVTFTQLFRFGPQSGHYVSWLKDRQLDPNSGWHKVNDNKAYPVSGDMLKLDEKEVTILVFRRAI